jgi:hypothetical protein
MPNHRSQHASYASVLALAMDQLDNAQPHGARSSARPLRHLSFSMQFVVFMDLVGTPVLPVAVVLRYVLVVTMAMNPSKTFEEAIPLMMLILVIGLPAFLTLITTHKLVYVFWMGIYLLALPIWNFVLPLYAYWHFDDFSWGDEVSVIYFYLRLC